MAKTKAGTTETSIEAIKVKPGFVSGTGRRKTAIASVFLYQEKGDFSVNGVNANDYFKAEKDKLFWMKPFHAIGLSHPTSQFSGQIRVKGSGKSSQTGAIIHAIARALAKIKDEYILTLSKQGLLTRDSRMVERKKPFLRKARKSPQYSKR